MGMGSGGFKSGTGNIPDLDVDSGTLSIDADNNRVGIGTTSPEGALHVKTAASHCSITLERNEKAGGEVGLNLNGGTGGKFWYLIQQSNSDNLTFHDTDAARVTFEHGGNVGIGTTTFDGSAAAYLTIANGTEPAAATADQIYIGSKDSTGLASDGATLSLRTEAAVQATALNAVGTLSHRTSIWINGTEYYLYLDPV